jgi:hypothetical protein
MTGSRQGAAGLVSLAESRSQAVALAARFRDNVLALRTGQAQPRRETEGLKSVYVEEWIGTLTSGRWVRLGPGRGGFFHGFSTRRGIRRAETPSIGPRSGARVACVLLEKRTRKGGWKARVLDRGLSGPVTNSADVPDSARPGQTVTLRVGAVDEMATRIQFQWLEVRAACATRSSF